MEPARRLDSIDHIRGLAILMMVLANFLAGVNAVPSWLKHAPDAGLTVADLVAPFFIFAIGLTYGLSARRRRERDGLRKTLWHFILRYLALLGIGAILSAGETWLGFNTSGRDWGVLQAIGMAGLITLPFIFAPAGWRLAAGLALLAIYQVLLQAFWLPVVLGSPHGGLPGSLGWAAMLLLSTVLADFFHASNWRRFSGMTALALLAGILLAIWVPISKNRVSASYVLVSVGASGVLFAIIYWLTDHRRIRLPLLAAWGRNPLLLYILHMILLGLFALPPFPGWYAQAPLWLAALQACALIALVSLAAGWLDRRGWHFSL
jgi:predicted acyltransferase